MFEIHGNTEGVRQTELTKLQAFYMAELDADTFMAEELVTALNEGTEAINGSITRIDNMNREVEVETGNVSEASDKQSGSMQEIITESHELTKTARELQEMLAQFTVDEA